MSNSNNVKQVGLFKYELDDVVAGPVIWRAGSECDKAAGVGNKTDLDGYMVGSSEWAYMDDDTAIRICAALTLFDGVPTEELERQANAAVSGD